MVLAGMSVMKTETTVVPGVRERAVRFPSGGETLAGVLALPEETDAQPMARRGVVLLHGWGTYRIGPHAILVKLAREFALRRIPALRFDFRGRGESTGEVQETGLDEMIDDAASAAKFIRKAMASETGRASESRRLQDVYGVGICSGGNVALASAALDEAYQGVAALSALPYQSHRPAMQSVRRTQGLLGKLFRKMLRLRYWKRLFTGEASVFRVFKTLFGGEGGKTRTADGDERNLKDSRREVMGSLAEYQGRVLFVFGGADAEGMGAKAHFEEFARANSLDASFHVVEGSNHNFYSLVWEREAMDEVLDFVGR
jgi:pimeloyl-ACP methyl ester carboxylesterase